MRRFTSSFQLCLNCVTEWVEYPDHDEFVLKEVESDDDVVSVSPVVTLIFRVFLSDEGKWTWYCYPREKRGRDYKSREKARNEAFRFFNQEIAYEPYDY